MNNSLYVRNGKLLVFVGGLAKGIKKKLEILGNLFGLGNSSYLGLGDPNNSIVEPLLMSINKDWKEISMKYSHVLAIKNDGTLWGWGNNWNFEAEGYMDLDYYDEEYDWYDKYFIYEPTQIGTDTWKTVIAGNGFSIGIRTDGTLWCWGSKPAFDFDFENWGKQEMIQIGNDSNWDKISYHEYRYVAIKTDGTAWVRGANTGGVGNLGVNSSDDFVLDFTQIGTSNNWVNCLVSSANLFLINSNNQLFGVGRNSNGSLGLGDTLPRTTLEMISNNITKITVNNVGYESVAVIKTDNSLWCWGFNENNSLGLGHDNPVYIPTLLNNDNWKFATYAEYGSFYGIKTNNTLWGFGNNEFGQLGTGNNDAITQITQLNTKTNWKTLETISDFTLLLNSIGEIYIVGGNPDYGEFYPYGRNLHYYDYAVSVNNEIWKQISHSSSGATLLKNDESAWFFSTSVSVYSPQLIDAGQWIDINENLNSSDVLMIKKDGTLWRYVYSSNILQQLGTESNWLKLGRSGFYNNPLFTPIIKSNGQLIRTGYPVQNMDFLTEPDKSDWVDVTWSNADGSFVYFPIDSMGNLFRIWHQDFRAINTATGIPKIIGTNFKQFHTDGDNNVGVKNDGTLWGYGKNANGQLGLGHTNPQHSWDGLIQLGTDTDWKKAIACQNGCLFLKQDGSLYFSGIFLQWENQQLTITKLSNTDGINIKDFTTKNSGSLLFLV
jgi:alpha-tubulin suppressor-like RCC1 family protein